MKRLIYFLGALGIGAFAASHLMGRNGRVRSRSSDRGLIDLNSASEKELLQLKGIGEVFAARIVENRPYATKLDLVGRRVVPTAAYEMIKDAVTVSSAA